MNKKLKVAWICHFTNEYVQNRLKPRKRMDENAPWITLGIEEAKKIKDIEWHIISPHRWISRDKEFSDGNIFYHFYNPGIPVYGRHWPSFFRFDVYSDFKHNKKKVKKFIDKINPDIIHLHGLENAYYSSTVFQFINKTPILATIQGFISLQTDKDNLNLINKKRVDVEEKLLHELENFAASTKFDKEEILKYNNKARIFFHEFFVNHKTNSNLIKNKKYDLVYFARVCREKGIEDLIISVGILREFFHNIKVAVIGGAPQNYFTYLKNLAKENKCLDNIEFFGFLPEQDNVYKILEKSKIYVLPTYNDTIPGSIVETMLRKVPVVSYGIGGIPEINEDDERILLSEKGDIEGLTNNISKLLSDDKYRENLANKAYFYAKNRWNNKKALGQIIEIYRIILNQ